MSYEQLVVEVKGIYAGLIMVEAKCVDLDERQSAAAVEKDVSKKFELKNDRWHSLIALHKQLLHEHHDFFLASQHPSASPALSRLAARYSMPARMWRHGIHAFLEVLRHRLPGSIEHMLSFLYIAYSMMALLYETVPAFEDTWIECLGGLRRYRTAIEDYEPKDEEVWGNVAKLWYSKASDKSPRVGRLYHHLAILALEQLSLYARSLTCMVPFDSAQGSVMTLFNPIPNSESKPPQHRPLSSETMLIKIHDLLFTSKVSDPVDRLRAEFSDLQIDRRLGDYITKAYPTLQLSSNMDAHMTAFLGRGCASLSIVCLLTNDPRTSISRTGKIMLALQIIETSPRVTQESVMQSTSMMRAAPLPTR